MIMKGSINKIVSLMTVKELADYLAEKINLERIEKTKLPSCDFALLDMFSDEPITEPPEYYYHTARSWYGFKQIDAGFDSNNILIVSDYYGGGCFSSIEIFDGGGNWGYDIKLMLLETLNTREFCKENDLLIVEFID